MASHDTASWAESGYTPWPRGKCGKSNAGGRRAPPPHQVIVAPHVAGMPLRSSLSWGLQWGLTWLPPSSWRSGHHQCCKFSLYECSTQLTNCILNACDWTVHCQTMTRCKKGYSEHDVTRKRFFTHLAVPPLARTSSRTSPNGLVVETMARMLDTHTQMQDSQI